MNSLRPGLDLVQKKELTVNVETKTCADDGDGVVLHDDNDYDDTLFVSIEDLAPK